MDRGVTDPEIKRQLARLRESPRFIRKPTLAKLLDYLLTRTLAGAPPEERDIGIKVLNRPPDWVPDADTSIVRVNLIRLKDSLAEYYANEGYRDPVEFRIVRHTVIANRRNLPDGRTLLAAGLNVPFNTARDVYFIGPEDSALRCVVTGETDDVGWHHLDSDPFNLALVNLVPLCGRLRSHLDAFRRCQTKTTLPELAPERLSKELAPRYFATGKTARAYGCAALAFFLGEPPYAQEETDVRLLRLCDVVHYARHRFFEPLMYQLIRQVLLPFIVRIDQIDPFPALRLTITLIALLEEAGYYGDAQMALTVANGLSGSNELSVAGQAFLEPFKLQRRKAQLLAERAPEDNRFEKFVRMAEERAGGDHERSFTLEVVRAQRWLRQGSYEGAKRAFELLAPLIAAYSEPVAQNGLAAKPARITIADLSEVFLLRSIAACRVQPADWQECAEESLAKGQRLMHLGSHVLPTEYKSFLSRPVSRNIARARRILQLTPAEIRPALRNDARIDLSVILKCLTRMRLRRKPGSQW
jgi:hypothetical protein